MFGPLDGSDPLTSSTAVEGDPFTDGFPGQEVPFGISDWGSDDVMVVMIAAKSLDRDIVEDSDVMEYPLGRDRVQLPAPAVIVDATAETVDLQIDPSTDVVPLGARIYYTQDGSDPGVAGNGEPLAGTLFNGVPFSPSTSVTVTGRTYAPAAFTEWFLPSESGAGSINLIGSEELYLGGQFAEGSGRRNIAKLAPNGSVDTGFNPGSGASTGSIVGAISARAGSGVLAGGNFETMNGLSRMGIVRLHLDGSVDTSFNADLE